MSRRALRGHVLVLAATIVGIIGFGLICDAFRYQSLAYATTGIPMVMVGLWWAGRELGRSNMASRSRKIRAARPQARPKSN